MITNKSFPRIVHKAPADLENPPVASKIPNRAKYFVIPQKAEVLVREELMQVSSWYREDIGTEQYKSDRDRQWKINRKRNIEINKKDGRTPNGWYE